MQVSQKKLKCSWLLVVELKINKNNLFESTDKGTVGASK